MTLLNPPLTSSITHSTCPPRARARCALVHARVMASNSDLPFMPSYWPLWNNRTSCNEHLPEVVHAINTRMLRVHGYIPSQLFIGRNACMDQFENSLRDKAMRNFLPSVPIPERSNYDVRMAQLEEMRKLTREKINEHLTEHKLSQKSPRYATPKQGDLASSGGL